MPVKPLVYFQKDSIVIGITIRNKKDVQADPTNGVEITLYDPAGATEVDGVAMTSGQYDEDNANTDGQYFYVFETDTDDVVGLWRADFNPDPGGTVEGWIVEKTMFRLADVAVA